MGLPERTHYGGMNVYGKGVQQSKYECYYKLVNKPNYAPIGSGERLQTPLIVADLIEVQGTEAFLYIENQFSPDLPPPQVIIKRRLTNIQLSTDLLDRMFITTIQRLSSHRRLLRFQR